MNTGFGDPQHSAYHASQAQTSNRTSAAVSHGQMTNFTSVPNLVGRRVTGNRHNIPLQDVLDEGIEAALVALQEFADMPNPSTHPTSLREPILFGFDYNSIFTCAVNTPLQVQAPPKTSTNKMEEVICWLNSLSLADQKTFHQALQKFTDKLEHADKEYVDEFKKLFFNNWGFITFHDENSKMESLIRKFIDEICAEYHFSLDAKKYLYIIADGCFLLSSESQREVMKSMGSIPFFMNPDTLSGPMLFSSADTIFQLKIWELKHFPHIQRSGKIRSLPCFWADKSQDTYYFKPLLASFDRHGFLRYLCRDINRQTKEYFQEYFETYEKPMQLTDRGQIIVQSAHLEKIHTQVRMALSARWILLGKVGQTDITLPLAQEVGEDIWVLLNRHISKILVEEANPNSQMEVSEDSGNQSMFIEDTQVENQTDLDPGDKGKQRVRD